MPVGEHQGGGCWPRTHQDPAEGRLGAKALEEGGGPGQTGGSTSMGASCQSGWAGTRCLDFMGRCRESQGRSRRLARLGPAGPLSPRTTHGREAAPRAGAGLPLPPHTLKHTQPRGPQGAAPQGPGESGGVRDPFSLSPAPV